jgi:glycogen synthase
MEAIRRANALFHQPAIWQRMMCRAMTRDFSWDVAARRYAAIYRELRPDLVASTGQRGDESLPA